MTMLMIAVNVNGLPVSIKDFAMVAMFATLIKSGYDFDITQIVLRARSEIVQVGQEPL